MRIKSAGGNAIAAAIQPRAVIDRLERRVLLSSISGSVFDDINGDGIQQAGEYNIPQQHVWADLNHDGAWEPGEPAAATDASGNYTLANLTPGSYQIRYYAPPGFRQTTPANGAPAMVTVVGAAAGVDFGVTPNSTGFPISGSVFNDLNGDGTQQSGEFGLPNQHVWIDTNNDNQWEPGEPATTTDANGTFTFAGLANGSHDVRYYAPPGFHQTTPLHSTMVAVTVSNASPAPISFGVTATAPASLHFNFDTRYDTSGFFSSHPQALTDLNIAAGAFSQFTDQLSAIAPSGGNTWSEVFPNPGVTGGPQATVNNSTVAANTLTIYIGSRSDVSGSELGAGGPGGWNASGSQSWLNTVSARGQTGALSSNPTTDFGPWGGAVTFSSTANWNFSTSPPSAGQNDFLSVALHELGHVLGVGTSASWTSLVANGKLNGAHSIAANGGSAPSVDNIAAHFAQGTESNVDGVPQEVIMEPDLLQGTRKQFTLLDYAGLEDIGWQVPSWL